MLTITDAENLLCENSTIICFITCKLWVKSYVKDKIGLGVWVAGGIFSKKNLNLLKKKS